jgi:NlpC/P60 family putative phage cell wall peptidase
MLDPRRAAVLAEAKSWIGTPYHHQARVKGAGVDCLLFLAEVYERAGIIEHVEVPFYRADFMQHRDEERYLEGVLAHGHEVATPLPADVVLYKWGRVFAHAGIVIAWPQIIHASASGHGVVETNGLDPELAYDRRGNPRPRKFVSPF